MASAPPATRGDETALDAPIRHLRTRPMEFVRAITRDVGPRPAGTPAEAGALQYAAEVLTTLGLEPGRDRFRVPPTWALASTLIAVTGLTAGLLVFLYPGVAAVVGAVALLFFLLEACTLRVLTRLLPTRRSGNVRARIPSEGPGMQTVVLVAHADTAKPRVCSMPGGRGPARVVWLGAALSLVAVPAVAVLVWASRDLLWALFLPIPLGFLGAWGALSVRAMAGHEATEGGIDNASGVAVVLAAAAELAATPLTHTRVDVAITGGKEAGLSGILALGARHRKAYPRARTLFVCVEGVGKGALMATTRQGILWPWKSDKELVGAVLKGSARAGVRMRTGVFVDEPTEAAALLVRARRAVTIVGVDRDGHVPFAHTREDRYDRVADTNLSAAVRAVVETARAIDAEAPRSVLDEGAPEDTTPVKP